MPFVIPIIYSGKEARSLCLKDNPVARPGDSDPLGIHDNGPQIDHVVLVGAELSAVSRELNARRLSRRGRFIVRRLPVLVRPIAISTPGSYGTVQTLGASLAGRGTAPSDFPFNSSSTVSQLL